jgi:hypothetical protein
VSPGPKPTGVKPRLVRLLDEEWDHLVAIAEREGLGDGRGGRTDAVQWLIRQDAAAAARHGPLAVECPKCGAPAGEPCESLRQPREGFDHDGDRVGFKVMRHGDDRSQFTVTLKRPHRERR